MGPTQWLYSPVSTQGLRKMGIPEIRVLRNMGDFGRQPVHLRILSGELGQGHPVFQALRKVGRANAARCGVDEIGNSNAHGVSLVP
jgi:hypothetical protein